MVKTGVCVTFRLQDLNKEAVEGLCHCVMSGLLRHLVVYDPHVATDGISHEMDVEFMFGCPEGEDADEKAQGYAELVVAQACKEAEVDIHKVTFVGLDAWAV